MGLFLVRYGQNFSFGVVELVVVADIEDRKDSHETDEHEEKCDQET